MTQYNMKKGLQKFGEQGAADSENEVRQLIKMEAIDTENPKYLKREYRYA